MPNPYHRPPPHRLWLSSKPYFMFILREMTSLFTAGFCIFLLVLIYALGEGPETYNALLSVLRRPWVVVTHLIVLLFSLYHTFTWFNLTPKVVVIWRGEHKVPESAVLVGVYTGWFVVSAVITWIIVTL